MGSKEASEQSTESSDDDNFESLLSTFSNYIIKQQPNYVAEKSNFDKTSTGSDQIKKEYFGNKVDFYTLKRKNQDCILNSKRLLKDLENSDDFVDPHSLCNLSKELGLPCKPYPFIKKSSFDFSCENVEERREKQSAKWSMEMVSIGVKHLHDKQFEEALKCFNQSISFYPKNVDAYVARGALKANRNELSVAVKDFQEALRLNPKHHNAKKYLVETLSNMARRFEKDMKWSDASSCYKDILEIDPSNKEALQQYSQIKQTLVSRKIECQPSNDLSKSKKAKIPLSTKSKERINRLKELLQAETHEDSSTSSSSSSDSESSEDAWVEASSQVWVEKSPVDFK